SNGAGALSISGHSLNAKFVEGLASVDMANKATITTVGGLIITGGRLTMHDSSIIGGVATVAYTLAPPGTSSLNAFGSSIQQLALRGSMALANSTLGAAASAISSVIIEARSSTLHRQSTD